MKEQKWRCMQCKRKWRAPKKKGQPGGSTTLAGLCSEKCRKRYKRDRKRR